MLANSASRSVAMSCAHLCCPDVFNNSDNTTMTAKPITNPLFPSPNNIAQRPRVAFIQSCWHRDIVDQLRDSFKQQFTGLSDKPVDFFEVPGAFEIPLHAKFLAQSDQYAGIVAAGLVVDGGIYRHEFVATTVVNALMQIQLETGTPVFSAVLTPHDFISDGQADFFKQHFVSKGIEAADACAETLSSMSAILS